MNARILLQRTRMEMSQRLSFLWSKARLLLRSDLFGCDFRQFFRTGFTHQHGNFVICWLAATLCCELLDSGVSLRAPHAVLFE